MYCCEKCGGIFALCEETVDNPSGLPGHTERRDVCPFCGSDRIEHSQMCPICKRYASAGDLADFGICPQCTKEALSDFIRFIKERFTLQEIRYIDSVYDGRDLGEVF